MENKSISYIKIIALLLAALISFAFLSKAASSPTLHAHEIASLDNKRINITRLTAAATAASVGVSLLPGDTATPIAENLADMTDYFLIALCAVYLEKYLITLTGFASFGVLFPLAFVLLAIHIKRKDPRFLYYAKKLIAFGIAIVIVIPASVKMSDTIESTYSFSLEEAIANAEHLSNEIEAESEALSDEESSGGFLDTLKDTTSAMVGTVVDKTTEWLSTGESILNEMLEALAVLLVTSCLIPIVVLLFFLWLVRLFADVNVPVPYPRRRHGFTRKLLKLK